MKNISSARATQLYALLLVFVAATTAGAFFLVWVHGTIVRKPTASSIDLIVEAYRGLVAPEPTEHFVFVTLAALVPISALAAVASSAEPQRIFRAWGISAALPIAIACLSLWPLANSDFLQVLSRDFLKPASPIDTWFLGAVLILAAVICRWLAMRPSSRALGERLGAWVPWTIFLAAVVLQIAAWRIVGFASVLPVSPWHRHADPLFYVMAQVQFGKTLLVDLPSQYGLFAEMLGPLFGIIGLTVGRATAVFGVLQFLSMFALFYVLQKLVRSRVLLTIAGLALVLLTYGTVLLNASYLDRYFQYWPLRLFWTATSVAVFHWFSRLPSYRRSAAMSTLSAVAMLWNLDSGLAVCFAFGAYLAARAAMAWKTRREADWRWQRYAFALVAHVLITALIAAAFLAALELKAGQPLHLSWLFEYQSVFAELGLAMLPLPRSPHPWMVVLAVYLGGLLQAFFLWKHAAHASARADTIFYLSMLGLGLFVYYAGRSHPLNLVIVCWPAAMLIAAFADDIVRRVRAGALAVAHLSIAVACVGVLLLCAISFLARTPSLAQRTVSQITTRGQPDDPLATNELAFIKSNSPPGTECLILSLRQGIYHAQAQLGSPFVGPGIVETVLIADQQKMMKKLFNKEYPCLYVGVGPDSAPNFKIDTPKLLEAYRIVGQSPGGTMLYLKPKLQ